MTPKSVLPVWAAPLFLATAALSWSGNHVVARAIAGHTPPWTLNVFRWLIVTIVVGLVAHKTIRADWPTLRAKAWTMAALGASGGGIFGTLQYVSLQYTGVVNMGVLNSLAPALIVFAAWALFRDTMRPLQLGGLLISLSGVLAIISRLDVDVLTNLAFNRGDVIIIANMVIFAVYSACLRLAPKVAMPTFLFALSIGATLTNVPFAIHEYANGLRFVPDAMSLAAASYAGIINSIIAYVCWSLGVAAYGPGRASAFLHLIPLFNISLAVTLFGEAVARHHVVGFALILLGVSLTARRP